MKSTGRSIKLLFKVRCVSMRLEKSIFHCNDSPNLVKNRRCDVRNRMDTCVLFYGFLGLV